MRISDPQRTHIGILLFCILLQGTLALIFALTLRYELKTSGLDGMAYEQIMHNLIHGKGFYTSVDPPFIPQHWLGIHFSPILFLLVPFYWLFPHIETFLVIGSAALALAAWPIYLTARTILADSFQALIIALLYLINPFVFNAIVWDFHEIDFAPLCIAWMLWAVVHKKRYTLLALSAVLFSIKEHYGLAIAGFGLLWAWEWRETKLGMWIAANGLAIMCFIFFVAIPYFNPTGAPMMMNSASPVDRFSWITSMAGIQEHAWPLLLAALAYAGHLLLPFMLLPLVAFMWLLPGIADLTVNVLAQTPMMRSPLSYHSAPLIPILLIALCVALKALFRGRGRITSNDALLPIVVLMVSYSYLQLALPFSESGNTWEFTSPRLSYTPEDRRALDTIHAMIPADSIVSAQHNVLPHLRPQYAMYPFPDKFADSSLIVLHLHFPYTNALTIFGTPFGSLGDRYFAKVEGLFANPAWGIVLADHRWVVLKKNAPDAVNARKEATEALAQARQEYNRAHEKVMGPPS